MYFGNLGTHRDILCCHEYQFAHSECKTYAEELYLMLLDFDSYFALKVVMTDLVKLVQAGQAESLLTVSTLFVFGDIDDVDQSLLKSN